MLPHRKRNLIATVAVLFVFAGATTARGATSALPDDKYAWLGDQYGTNAVRWAEEQTRRTERVLKSKSYFGAIKSEMVAARSAGTAPAEFTVLGPRIARFLRTAEHPQGVLQTAVHDASGKVSSPWKSVLDLDALNHTNGTDFELHLVGVGLAQRCLPPAYERCLLPFSRGGTYDVEYREYDLVKGNFVPNGFVTPANRSMMAWLDANTVLIAHSLDGHHIASGRDPSILRLWKRGTPLASASRVFEAEPEDSGFLLTSTGNVGTRYGLVSTFTDLTHFRLKLVNIKGEVKDIELPREIGDIGSAVVTDHFLVARLAITAKLEGRDYPADTLVSYDLSARGTQKRVQAVFAPPNGTYTSGGFVATKHGVAFVVSRGLSKTLMLSVPSTSGWTSRALLSTAPGMSLHLADTDDRQDILLLKEQGFLNPATVTAFRPGHSTVRLALGRPMIDASRYVSEIRSARSKDGTPVDYFMVRSRGPQRGPIPTIINAYGAYGISVEPSYFTSGFPHLGASLVPWLTRGGAYVVAAVRGGGDRGSAWHLAGIGTNKQKSYDDFIGVAEDLVRTGFSSPGHIGSYGRSMGGLLSGVVATQRPDLFGAALIGVPVLDLFQSTVSGKKNLNDAQKVEIGDYDDPLLREEMLKRSPYQYVRPGVRYPKILVTTSTQDNQAGAGSARKFVAKLQDFGADALLLEGKTGGHEFPDELMQPNEAAMQIVFYVNALMRSDDPDRRSTH